MPYLHWYFGDNLTTWTHTSTTPPTVVFSRRGALSFSSADNRLPAYDLHMFAQSVKLAISRNRQVYCSVCEKYTVFLLQTTTGISHVHNYVTAYFTPLERYNQNAFTKHWTDRSYAYRIKKRSLDAVLACSILSCPWIARFYWWQICSLL